MTQTPTIYEWQSVPSRVSALLPEAFRIKAAHEIAAERAGLLATTIAAWRPEEDFLTLYVPTQHVKTAHSEYREHMRDLTGRGVAPIIYEQIKPDLEEEIVVKCGASIPVITPVWNTSNKLLGGPNPLTNGIVTSLLAGGLGYGAGALAEQLFPARYVERGKLRRTLGLIGALSGVGLAGLNSYANARALNTSMLRGLVTNNKTPVVYPTDKPREKAAFRVPSGGETGAFLNEPMFSPTVSVPQFNQAAWQDVNLGLHRGFNSHTPPQFAAATTGLMSGISTNMNSPIIRPIDVVRGIASAGVGLATATVAGKALSALAGLTPEGQSKLQDMGLWGGMMHAIVPSMFGR